MTVKFIKKPKPVAAPVQKVEPEPKAKGKSVAKPKQEPVEEAPPPRRVNPVFTPSEPIEGRPEIGAAKKFGKATVLPDIDVHDVLGHVKFLVHLKKDIWYRVLGYDEQENILRLQSALKVRFESKIDRTVGRNYMVVMEPEGTEVPSKAAVKFVRTLLEGMPELPPWEDEGTKDLPEPDPKPSKEEKPKKSKKR